MLSNDIKQILYDMLNVLQKKLHVEHQPKKRKRA